MFSLRQPKTEEQGFTLVELLVVIIIIGILAAIAIPVFLNQRQRANDATLKSDTRNVANELTAWFNEGGGRGAEDLVAITNSTHPWQVVLGVYGPDKPATNPQVDWNNYPTLPTLTASGSNQITITVNRGTSGNYTKHDPGDFCLSSNAPNSNYNYSYPGATGHANYDKLVYFDVQLGGIVDMEDMVQAVQDGAPSSCSHFAKGYMSANSIPIP